jgi:hypothetical protein
MKMERYFAFLILHRSSVETSSCLYAGGAGEKEGDSMAGISFN